jgi:hypothetical protein
MRPLEADPSLDQEIVFQKRFDEFRREFLKTIVTPEVIEEHRRCPLGQHSEPLERLLIYLRQHRKYAIRVVEPFKDYRLVTLSGHRGIAPRAIDDKIYRSSEEAYHGLFLHFIRDLFET